MDSLTHLFRFRLRLSVAAATLRAGIVMLVALAIAGALAQERSTGTAPPKYSVSGTVVNSVTGEPVRRAQVTLSGQQFSMTDSNGHFRFAGVPGGMAVLSAEKPGFFNPVRLSRFEDPSPTMIQMTSDLENVVLKLVPQAMIAGRVTSVEGEPIEDFPVRLHLRKNLDGGLQWESAGATQTDEDGQFRIANLAPGQYCLSTGPERMRMRAPGTRQRGYAQVFYANAPDLASATGIGLSPGQQFEADFALNQEPLYEISGQVIGVPHGGSAGFSLFSNSGEHLNVLRYRPEQQQFSGYVPAGKYVLRFFSQLDNQQLAATVPLSIAANTSGIQAVLSPQISIPVNIRTESNAAPRAGRQTYPAMVRLRPNAGSLEQNDFVSAPLGQQNSPGIYIQGVPPGSYSVEVQPFGSFYVQSASSGSTDLLREQLAITSGARIDPIEVVLRDDGGHVSGAVEGQGVGATVLLVPERLSPSYIKTTETQGEGSFSFEQVRPGDYLVLAFDRADELEYRNPEVLASYLSNAAHVTVAPGQHAKVNLELIRLGK